MLPRDVLAATLSQDFRTGIAATATTYSMTLPGSSPCSPPAFVPTFCPASIAHSRDGHRTPDIQRPNVQLEAILELELTARFDGRFVYRLGPAMKALVEVRTGAIKGNVRYAHGIDTSLCGASTTLRAG